MAAIKIWDYQRANVAAVQEHAKQNYDKGGWDFVVETMDFEDIFNIVWRARTEKGAIQKMADYLGPLAAHRDDIINS